MGKFCSASQEVSDEATQYPVPKTFSGGRGLLAVGVPVAALAPTTTLVSVNRAGTGSGNGFSVLPALSTDGRAVAFQSSASDLVVNDTNGEIEDVFAQTIP